MKRLFPIIITIIVLLSLVLPVAASSSKSQPYPYFYILEVDEDNSVTIQVYNAPANDSFRATMGEYGTLGIGGVVVGDTSTGSGGSFVATYSIPSTLAGREKIAIRLESPTSGYYAYNWFYNNPSSSSTSTPPSTTPVPGYTGYPTFSIVSVVADETVTIKTSNFPSNDTFTVTMGNYGTKGVGGTVVASTNSGSGGTLTLTYDIPDSLIGLSKIAIRMESPTSGYYAYNWFYNNTAAAPTSQPPAPTTAPPGYSGYPTFSIASVVKDQSVTISGKNFPANDTFTVLMGPYGSQGIGGTNVGSTSTGSGGSLSATYSIPASLAGSTKIAIRMQSSTSGFYAYNWFWNSSTP